MVRVYEFLSLLFFPSVQNIDYTDILTSVSDGNLLLSTDLTHVGPTAAAVEEQE
jgi:hypothetical protein